VGVFAPGSLVSWEQAGIFLDRSGEVHAVSAGGITERPLNEMLGRAIIDSAASADWARKASATIYERKYRLAVVRNASTTVTDVYVGDLLNGWWTVWRGDSLRVRTWGQWTEESDPTLRLYYGSWDNGVVYEMDRTATSDNGAAITTVAKSPAYRIPGSYTLWKELTFFVDNTDSVYIEARLDKGDTTVTRVFYPPRIGASPGLSRAAGDTTKEAGYSNFYRFTINEKAYTCQLTVKSIGTGRFRFKDAYLWYEETRGMR